MFGLHILHRHEAQIIRFAYGKLHKDRIGRADCHKIGLPRRNESADCHIVDAELTDTAAWYLAAAPAAIDTFEVAFLDGVQSPFIEQRESWDTDGIEYKVRLDFGVKCWDYRGLYKNPGASE